MGQQEQSKLYKFLHRKRGFLYMPPRDVCIVTGCPRSGNTAILRWLSQSNQVAGFSEPRIFQAISAFIEKIEYYEALYRNKDILEKLLKKLFYSYATNQRIIWNKIIVMKEPLGGVVTGPNDLISRMKKLFSELKTIFMVRHPVSVFNSMKNRKWGLHLRNTQPWDMSLDDGINIWKSSINAYMNNKNDNLYLCKFENLVRDPEAESAKIQKFLKLKQLNAFIAKDIARIDLEEKIVQKILDETEEERRLFDYV